MRAMRGACLAGVTAALPLLAGAQEQERERTTVGALNEQGYVVGPLTTSPATDAAVNRFGFVMEHPEGGRPLFACRLMVGSGDPDSLEPLVMINACERIE